MGKAFLYEGRDERCVFEPEAEPVSKDLETTCRVEVAELGRERRWRWPERLVELLLLWV